MSSVALLTRTIAAHDPAEAGHAERVTQLALDLAEALEVGPGPLEAVRAGGPLHDVGKLAVSDTILQKPGPLSPEEQTEIRLHPVIGARLVVGIGCLSHAVDCVLHHHERWDGTGYPAGLAGCEIPLEARILAVADAYDAMTTNRPYQAALTHDAALDEVDRCSGGQFDPTVARAFLALVGARDAQPQAD
jgi:putative nucleotidyltransferase with HDIG domain